MKKIVVVVVVVHPVNLCNSAFRILIISNKKKKIKINKQTLVPTYNNTQQYNNNKI